ncbi:MAG: hypothetical protein ACREMB_18620 [Candidatus Rokuibacteriota bacterium]
MGGPWRSHGFDPARWRTPVARVQATTETIGSGGARDYVVGIVIGYVASVLTSIVIMLTVLKTGW